MKAEYDLSKMKSRRNPYAAKLKKPVSMRLSEDVVDYFKDMAKDADVPYQSLINLYLRDCVMKHRSEEHTSELQSLMRISYAVFCLKKKNTNTKQPSSHHYSTHPIYKK